MNDLMIIGEIEKELKIKLKRKYRIHFNATNGYKLNDNGKVVSLVINRTLLGDSEFKLITCLKELKYLDLFANEITNISSIKTLSRLESLHLGNNKIEKIQAIRDLTCLKTLYLGGNKIQDINPLRKLINLNLIHLGNNGITNLEALKNLTKLKDLNISMNKLTDINSIKNLQDLKDFSCSFNQIKDIKVLKHLEKLETIDLSSNVIENIEFLFNLTKAQYVNLSNNNLTSIPKWLTKKNLKISTDPKYSRRKGIIFLEDNPLKSPPLDVVSQGNDSINNYFNQLSKEKGKIEYLFEVKLLVIGEGGTGKTTFTRKVQDVNAKMPQSKDTTFGIDISKWNYTIDFPSIPELRNVKFNVNLWDFGGQKIYQGTHQMFFSDKLFYVLIADTREQKTDFAYWLNTVEQLGGEDSSLMIILNKKFGHEFKFDESGYRNRFGKLIKEIVELDLKNEKDKVLKLQEIVKNSLKQLSGIGDPLPSSWVKIRDDLSFERKNYISFDRFIEICSKNNINNSSMISTLSQYYNRIGVFTHYIDDPVLQERIYLNSNWLVKTVYEILDNPLVSKNKGRLSESDIVSIWSKNKLNYEINKLTQLMHKFGLMYHIDGTKNYVVPAHLPTITPYNEWEYSKESDILQFNYEFDKYMPKGIMSRLIVALHHHIEDHSLVWHRGVNIRLNNTYAEIIESYGGSNLFEIKIHGNDRNELLAIIRDRFEIVLKPFSKLNYKQQVPCVCVECKNSHEPTFHEYKKLIKIREKVDVSQCSSSGELVKIQDLLKVTISKTKKKKLKKKNTIKLFLASSNELINDRKEFEIFINRENKHLNKKGIFIDLCIWEDFIDSMSQTRLQDEYNKVIIESDIFVSLFFTKVGKYTEEEFDTAFKNFKENNTPHIYTYFKDSNISSGNINVKDVVSKDNFQKKLRELGHFQTGYTTIDNLKYKFKMQLDKILPSLCPIDELVKI